MSVTDADDGMTAVEVKVFMTFRIPNATSFALNNFNGEKRIYRKK